MKRALFFGLLVFALPAQADETICQTYNRLSAQGYTAAPQAIEAASQVNPILSEEGKTAATTMNSSSISFFRQEAVCASQMVPLAQQYYNTYKSMGNSALSYYALPVNGTVTTNSNTCGGNCTNSALSPVNGTLADFSDVSLLAIGQGIQNTILATETSIAVQQNSQSKTAVPK
jgi:hypothetical protein